MSMSMLLPDSIDLAETDFDHDDLVHEQTKQNEVTPCFPTEQTHLSVRTR